MNRRLFNKNCVSIIGFSILAFKTKLVFAQISDNLQIGAKTVAKKIDPNTPPAVDNRTGFGLADINKTIQTITNGQNPNNSNLIFLNKINNEAPDGRRVPIEITTSLTKVQKIAVLFDKNPNITCAIFDFNETLEPYVATSIKMQQSGTLNILVQSNNQWFIAKKVVKVLIGGCGA